MSEFMVPNLVDRDAPSTGTRRTESILRHLAHVATSAVQTNSQELDKSTSQPKLPVGLYSTTIGRTAVSRDGSRWVHSRRLACQTVCSPAWHHPVRLPAQPGSIAYVSQAVQLAHQTEYSPDWSHPVRLPTQH